MKRITVFIVCFVALMMFSGCRSAEPVVRVILQEHGSDDGEYFYGTVYDNQKVSKTDEFESDDIDVYTALASDFSSDVVDGKVVNSLEGKILTDEEGAETEADETMSAIMQAAADNIDHAIWSLQIINDGNRYFAFIKLNVNWSDPCYLYEYDAFTGEFNCLCRFDNVDLMGLSVGQSQAA